MIEALRDIERENARCSREWDELIKAIGPEIGSHALAVDLAGRQGIRLKKLNENHGIITPWNRPSQSAST